MHKGRRAVFASVLSDAQNGASQDKCSMNTEMENEWMSKWIRESL